MAIICWGNLAKSAESTQRIEQAIQAYIETHEEDPNAHMGADYALGSHRLQTVLDHPYGSIKYYHVYDIHADQITAGAMIIKGNGPYISLRDESNNERVKIYPEGIIVKEGKLWIENKAGKTIVDEQGIKGGNVFFSSEKNLAADQDVPGLASWYNAVGMAHGFYLSRDTPVMVFGQITATTNEILTGIDVRIKTNTGYWPPTDQLGARAQVTAEDTPITMNFINIIQLYTGFNLLQMVVARSWTTSTINLCSGVGKTSFGYMILGN